jgi:hypothetical protein
MDDSSSPTAVLVVMNTKHTFLSLDPHGDKNQIRIWQDVKETANFHNSTVRVHRIYNGTQQYSGDFGLC